MAANPEQRLAISSALSIVHHVETVLEDLYADLKELDGAESYLSALRTASGLTRQMAGLLKSSE